MRNVLMDCDPGIDDAIALIELLGNQDELNILGITTVGGNVSLENVTNNAKKILSTFKQNIPIASGSNQPIIKDLYTAPEIHGATGMDGYEFSDDYQAYPLASDEAVEFLFEQISKVDSVELIATAPLTNIALLIKTHPKITKKIKHIYIMGGSLEQGNITAAAEFNFYVDPDAADIVLNSDIPITLSGLHMTEDKAFLTYNDISEFKKHGLAGDICYKLMNYYHQAELTQGLSTSPMHDICAVASFLRPDLFLKKDYSIQVVTDNSVFRGMSLADKRLQPEINNNISVLMDVDRLAFRDFLYESIDKLNKKILA